MSRIFVSGSATGLGLMAGELLASQGHQVVLHARNANRAEDARRALPQVEAVVVGDIETIAGAKDVAAQVNSLGHFGAVIHNAAVGYREGHRVTSDGLPHVFAINTLSAYILTALIERPKKFVYLSSGMHQHAQTSLDDILWKKRRWNGSQAYAESKLHDAMLAFAVSRRWPEVLSNALEPGWVPTKMGGPGAPGDMDQAHLTQAWLATSDAPATRPDPSSVRRVTFMACSLRWRGWWGRIPWVSGALTQGAAGVQAVASTAGVSAGASAAVAVATGKWLQPHTTVRSNSTRIYDVNVWTSPLEQTFTKVRRDQRRAVAVYRRLHTSTARGPSQR